GAIAARPGGAFYGLVHIDEEAESALAFAKRLLVEGGVAVVPGDTFGASTARMVRLAFTIDDANLRAGLQRLGALLTRSFGRASVGSRYNRITNGSSRQVAADTAHQARDSCADDTVVKGDIDAELG